MDRSFPRRFDISKFTFVFFALSVSIFGWGLRYKLSLYEPHAVTHSMPEAKLLSRDESQAQSGSYTQQRDPVPSPQELVLAGAPFFCALSANRAPGVSSMGSRELERPWLRIGLQGLDGLFFRPPPALV